MFLSLKCFGMSLYEKICDWHIGAQEMCPAELKAKRPCIRDFIAPEGEKNFYFLHSLFMASFPV